MKVWVGFDDYGVAGEGPFFRGVYATEDAAMLAMEAGCYGTRVHGWAKEPHRCEAAQNRYHNQIHRCWWFIQEEEVHG